MKLINIINTLKHRLLNYRNIINYKMKSNIFDNKKLWEKNIHFKYKYYKI